MDLDQRQQLEREWHETEDKSRDENQLIVDVYASSLFREAEDYQLDALSPIDGTTVLDFGCGTGESSGRLRQRGAIVVGFDISRTRLSEANAHSQASGNGPSASFLLCAAETLPFADASFDAVYGKQILHHLDLEIAIDEVVRVLRPGGRAVFLEPLIHNPLLEGYRRRTRHLRSPTEKALSMRDLQRMGTRFRRWEHREFILFSVLPVLMEAMTSKKRVLTRLQERLQVFDRKLIGVIPFLGRYCWETVVVLER